MVSEAKLYFDAIYRATDGQIPVWYPGRDISLGHIGTFEDGRWIHKKTLEEVGIPFRPHHDKTPSEGLDLGHGYSWSTGVAVDAQAKVPGIPGGPQVEGSLQLSLSGSGSFVLKSSDSLVHYIKNLDEVEGEMISLFRARDGRWAEDWCVVSEVYVASRSFVAVSDGNEASLSIDLGAKPAGAFLDLASVNAGAHIGNTSHVAGKVLALDPAVLTFGIRRVDRDWTTGMLYVDTPLVVRGADLDKDMKWEDDSQSFSPEN